MMKHLVYTIFAALFMLGASEAQAKSAPLTLEDIVTARMVSGAEQSPDGNYIAYLKYVPRTPYKDKKGSAYQELHVINKAGKSKPFIVGDVNIGSIAFSPDSQFIYYLAKRDEDKHTAIYKIAVDGGESSKVTKFKSNISGFSFATKGDRLVFWAQEEEKKSEKKLTKKGFDAEIYEEDRKPNQLWLLDFSNEKKGAEKVKLAKHIVSAKFSPVDDRLLVGWTEAPLIDAIYMEQKLSIVDLKGKVQATIPSVGKLGAAHWSPDAKHIAFIGAEDLHDPATGRLYLYNTKAKKVKNLLPKFLGHVDAITWRNTRDLMVIASVGVESELVSINVNNEKKSIIVPAGKAIFRKVLTDKSGKKLSAIANTATHPNELVSIDSKGKLKHLSESNPDFANKTFAKQEVVTYKARDGLELQGILVRPLNEKKNTRYPLILFVHGGPEAHLDNGWINRYSTPSQFAAAQGYVSFYPNYRGSTGRGVAFSKLGQGDYAGAEFNDIVDAKDHFVKIGLVDKEKVGITGGSYGGYASAWGATALTEHYAASVMFVGISNQLSKFGTTDIPNEMYNVHSRSWPWDKWQWMLEQSPIYHAKKAKTPLLILHGKEDTRVHPSQSMELYRYIKTATKTPVRLVFYPGEGHGNRKVAAQLDYGMRLMRWMDAFLKEKAKAMPPYELPHADKLKKDKDNDKDEDAGE